jgi:tripartite-type tricarboxylate transporter receptor subunit TctC
MATDLPRRRSTLRDAHRHSSHRRASHRHALRMIAGAVAVTLLVPGVALAQAFPAKPIRMVVPSQAGGPPDFVARVLAARMVDGLGQPIVIENRGGGGGILAAEAVATAPADGYTLLFGSTASISIAPNLYAKIAYSPTRSFAPIGLVSNGPFVVAVNAAFPAKTLQDLVALGREKPGTINFGSSGNATPLHIIGEMFNKVTGARLVHVPYKGPPAAVTALLQNDVQAMFELYPSFPQHVAAGKVRILAVTGAKRSARLPDVPTAIEAGLAGFEFTGWTGVLAPAGTPPDVVKKLNEAVVAAVESKEVREALSKQGLDTVSSTSEEFGQFVAREAARWGNAVRESGAKVD